MTTTYSPENVTDAVKEIAGLPDLSIIHGDAEGYGAVRFVKVTLDKNTTTDLFHLEEVSAEKAFRYLTDEVYDDEDIDELLEEEGFEDETRDTINPTISVIRGSKTGDTNYAGIREFIDAAEDGSLIVVSDGVPGSSGFSDFTVVWRDGDQWFSSGCSAVHLEGGEDADEIEDTLGYDAEEITGWRVIPR